MKNVIATWSGGKDSCFAAYKAQQKGYSITYLANTVSEEHKRVRFHGIRAEVVQGQAKAIGIPLLQQETTAESYEKEFKENIKKGLTKDISGIVFGDIHLEDCLTWAKKVSRDLGVKEIEPLWHMKQLDILKEFIQEGFEAVIVGTQNTFLGKEWVGRKIDNNFIQDIIRQPNVDPCGENGEYHSFVINGPLFKQKIEIAKSEIVLRDGYWFLDIQEYKLTPKT